MKGMSPCLIREVSMGTDPYPGVCERPSVPHSSNRLLFRNALAAVLFLAAFGCVAQDGQSGSPAEGSNAQATPNAGNQSAAEQKAGTADTDRKQQITSDSSQLLTMAIALKAEVDKTNKDTLSMNVIRKADEIEKLAHTVKEKIKQGGGPG